MVKPKFSPVTENIELTEVSKRKIDIFMLTVVVNQSK